MRELWRLPQRHKHTVVALTAFESLSVCDEALTELGDEVTSQETSASEHSRDMAGD